MQNALRVFLDEVHLADAPLSPAPNRGGFRSEMGLVRPEEVLATPGADSQVALEDGDLAGFDQTDARRFHRGDGDG